MPFHPQGATLILNEIANLVATIVGAAGYSAFRFDVHPGRLLTYSEP